jgi:hypothetical protein
MMNIDDTSDPADRSPISAGGSNNRGAVNEKMLLGASVWMTRLNTKYGVRNEKIHCRSCLNVPVKMHLTTNPARTGGSALPPAT